MTTPRFFDTPLDTLLEQETLRMNQEKLSGMRADLTNTQAAYNKALNIKKKAKLGLSTETKKLNEINKEIQTRPTTGKNAKLIHESKNCEKLIRQYNEVLEASLKQIPNLYALMKTLEEKIHELHKQLVLQSPFSQQ